MYESVSYVPRRTNHLLHLILTLATCGLWAFVWITITIINKAVPERHVTQSSVPPQVWGPGPNR